ncbi:MAG: endo-1,3-1,4-beta-glycanase ExsH [Microcystis flos-aquae TF09]|uniref:Endo-1,3-1,4-beta-glycanase ExsH n=4 Tax=Microcystis TaxID=1125 RepID=A0A3E0L3L4_9CHRO|nr:MAG: endo-1,3-1,4-beta-glycanase ExsH [Microcystis flos-aquae TF09]
MNYDFQSVGEFTLVKSTTDDFEIQTRQQPWNGSTSVSVNSAIAIKLGGQRIGFYLNDPNPLKINGIAANLPNGQLYAIGQNLIVRDGDSYSIFSANNDYINIDFNSTYININLGLAENRKGNLIGLLGNYNGTTNDDFALRNGTVIGGTITTGQLYGEYDDSWRITQATSLFDYGTGQNTNTFTDLTFPNNVITIDSLTPAQRAAAEQIAINAGITDPDILNDAILDIFLTNGAPEIIQGYVTRQRQATISATNTLINPEGFGDQHWLTSGEVIPYTIRFTNNAAAGTIPVAQVTITQTLDSDLDLNTFTLQDFGFGNITVNVPVGTRNYSQRLDLRTTRGVFVDVNASLNTSTRVLTWTFIAIDPTTGNPANITTQGFLPPNDANGSGTGFVGYSIQPKANNPTNTRIDAQASITLNTQTIQTNPVFNTVGDTSVTLAVSPASVTEDGTTNLIYTFTRTGVTTNALTVNYTLGGTATLNTDYTRTGTTNTVTFAANSATATVTVDPTADTTVETDETVILTLASGTGYTIGTTTPVTGTITNDDVTLPSITLAVSPASVTEDGTTNLIYTFTRTGVTTNALTVNYTLGGTATLNTDYTRTGTTNTVTFAANSATATVTVDPTADTIVEPNETVILTLAAGTGYTVGTTTPVTGTITNDDVTLPSITLAVSPASVTEDGTTNLIYTFTRTGVTTNALTVNYTLGGTATLNTDYTRTGTTNTVTFAANSATATVTVDPTADTIVESNETVILTLASGTGYTVGTTTPVTGTITNDDVTLPSITLAVSPASVTEDGTTNLIYTFTRTGVTTNALTVNYTLGGTATLNTDYTRTGTTNTVTFAANSATATVTVDPTADTIVESNETVILTLASGTGYTVGTTTPVTGTITNDDVTLPSITLAVSPASVTEDGTTNLVYTFTRTGVTTNALTVNYTLGGTATLNTDYTRTGTTNTVTFAANSATATVTVDPTADTTIEPNETVILTLAAGTGYTVGTTTPVTGTITNDDVTLPSITLAVSPASVTEDGTTNLVYTFTRTGVTTNPLTVNYSIGGTATNGTDYAALPSSIAFAAGLSTATVIVDPTADTTVEPNETVILTLASGTGYTVGTTTPVTGTITNDDFPQLSINNITVVEGLDNNAILTVTVNNSNPQPISFNYTTAPINATANVDYTSKTGTITIAANTSTATISIPILNDNLNEPDEAFTVTLSNPVNATINPEGGIGEVIITDTWQSSLTRTLPNNVENLRLIGSNNINGTGNAGNNNITGNNGINQINGGAGIDTLTGGLGADTFIFQFGQSTISTSDRITDFAINSDKIDLLTQTGNAMSAPSSFSRAADSTVTTLDNLINQVFTDANGAITGNQGLGVNSAALVQVTTGAIAGTYLVINDSTAGFQSSNDLLINITGFTGTLPALGSIPVGNFFI